MNGIKILDKAKNELVRDILISDFNVDNNFSEIKKKEHKISQIENMQKLINADPCKNLTIMGMSVTYSRASSIFTILLGSLASPLLKVLAAKFITA